MELRNLNDEETEIYNSWLEAESVECIVKEEAMAALFECAMQATQTDDDPQMKQIRRDTFMEARIAICDMLGIHTNSDNGWISVTDRMPCEMKDRSIESAWSSQERPTDDLLILLTTGRQAVAWYSYVHDVWTTVDENTSYVPEEVAFWQPLPGLPKEFNRKGSQI